MNCSNQTKRILIISLLFEPDTRVGGKRFSFLSRILKKKYPDLHVLTLKEKYIPHKDHSLTSTGTIHRTGMYPSFPIETNSIFKRIFIRLWLDYLCPVDKFSGWILPALFKGLKIVKANKIDLIITTGPPFSSMVVAFLLSLMTSTKLVLDYRDPWSSHNRKSQKVLRKEFNKIFEKLIVGRASALVFCSRIMMEDFRYSLGKYTKATYHVVTNGFCNRDAIEPISLGNGRKNMVYAGKFYGERRIGLLVMPLFHLLNQGTINKDNFCCYIFGNLSDEDWELINRCGLNGIFREQPMVPYQQMLRYLKGADILFLPSGSDVNYAIPFKFFDYLSVKRPILAVAPENSAVAELMNKINCGRLAFINSEESIIRNLRAMVSVEEEYPYSGAEQYTWENIGDKYIKLIDRIG